MSILKQFLTLFKYFLLFLFSNQVQAQNISLNTHTHEDYEAFKSVLDQEPTSTRKLEILKDILHKARKVKDTSAMSNCYLYLSKVHSDTTCLIYTDSIIDLTKNSDHKNYPALAYVRKGEYYFDLGDLEGTLDSYITASHYARQRNNKLQFLSVKFEIAQLRSLYGDHQKALKEIGEYLLFLEQSGLRQENYELYNKGIYKLAEFYTYNKQLDAARLKIVEGTRTTLLTQDSLSYLNFVILSGIHHYFAGDFQTAIDSLKSGRALVNKMGLEFMKSGILNYYIGKSLAKSGNTKESLPYFERVDSILQQGGVLIPELLDSYNELIQFHRSSGDLEKQLYYTNSLLSLDSILKSEEIHLMKNIFQYYDAPQLVSDREKIIEDLGKAQDSSKKIEIILAFISGLLLLIAIFYVRKSIVNKKRFNVLLEEYQSTKNHSETLESKNVGNNLNSGLGEDLTKNIIQRLEKFERSGKYIKKGYTLHTLAKELNTNSAYLSKIINATKSENFSHYLNDLRVNYAIDKLMVDRKFRSYKIKAIADEVGFNTAQSFSTAFYKKTRL